LTARPAPLVTNLALSLASIGACALLLEAFLRAAGYAPPRYQSPAGAWSPRERILLDCYPSNPRGYFDLDLRDGAVADRYRRLGVQGVDEVAGRDPYAVELRFNSLRFRAGEFGPKRAGVLRVMVLGDSFTEGQGVKEADTYPAVLERLLNSAGPGRWEVLNCGRRAADFPTLHKMFERILPFEPDLVVYGMVLNDADRSAAFNARHPRIDDWILDRRRMIESPEPVRLGPLQSRLAALVEDRVDAWRIHRAGSRWYLELYGEPNREGWERTQGYLREMDRRLEERGARLLVASWPLLVNLEGEDPFAAAADTIARFCLSAGIARHDLRPALRGRPTESLWVHPVDRHPNELAHRLAAGSLVEAVRHQLASGPTSRSLSGVTSKTR
jgi:hypothetical protein